MNNAQNASISLNGASQDYQSAVVYAVTQDSADIKILDVQNDLNTNTIQVELPPLSVAQIVISAENSDVVIPEEPNITTEKVTYSFDELEISENGYPMIPLGDKEHLKEILVNTTVTSNAGSGWASGGGALCFNKVVQNGNDSEVWGNKPFTYSLGTMDNTVEFDENFTVIGEDAGSVQIEGSCNDEYTELQNWWASSESDPQAGADISVTYNYVTLVYEYTGDTPEGTTTTPAETTTTEETTATTTETTETLSTETTITEETTASTADTTEVTPAETTTTEETTASTTETTEALPAEATLYGDTNLDGKIDLTDAILLNKAMASQVVLNDIASANADCDGIKGIDGNDAITLLQFLVHLVDVLPLA